MCPRCGKRPPVEGKAECQECSDYHAKRRVNSKEAGMCIRCRIRPPADGKTECQECSDYHAKRNAEIKEIVFKHYSGSEVPYCACCGDTTYEFLTIDHIDGDGAEHKRKNGYSGGSGTYHWLIKNNFPEGFRVLCWNCNSARGFFGYCPHENIQEK